MGRQGGSAGEGVDVGGELGEDSEPDVVRAELVVVVVGFQAGVCEAVLGGVGGGGGVGEGGEGGLDQRLSAWRPSGPIAESCVAEMVTVVGGYACEELLG